MCPASLVTKNLLLMILHAPLFSAVEWPGAGVGDRAIDGRALASEELCGGTNPA